jgi:hypothetical protein
MSSSMDVASSSTYANVVVTISQEDTGDGVATFERLITCYELMEMQGDLSPIDAKLREYMKEQGGGGASTSLPLPMGTFILPPGYAPTDPPPTKKSSCCLRLGTLSLEGEVGPPVKPMAVLKRIEGTPSGGGLAGSKRPRDEGDDGGGCPLGGAVESFGSWWGRRRPSTSQTAPSTTNTSFELVGVIKKRFHFKTKPTRQF